jgi:hypothetical protein
LDELFVKTESKQGYLGAPSIKMAKLSTSIDKSKETPRQRNDSGQPQGSAATKNVLFSNPPILSTLASLSSANNHKPW